MKEEVCVLIHNSHTKLEGKVEETCSKNNVLRTYFKSVCLAIYWQSTMPADSIWLIRKHFQCEITLSLSSRFIRASDSGPLLFAQKIACYPASVLSHTFPSGSLALRTVLAFCRNASGQEFGGLSMFPFVRSPIMQQYTWQHVQQYALWKMFEIHSNRAIVNEKLAYLRNQIKARKT